MWPLKRAGMWPPPSLNFAPPLSPLLYRAAFAHDPQSTMQALLDAFPVRLVGAKMESGRSLVTKTDVAKGTLLLRSPAVTAAVHKKHEALVCLRCLKFRYEHSYWPIEYELNEIDNNRHPRPPELLKSRPRNQPRAKSPVVMNVLSGGGARLP